MKTLPHSQTSPQEPDIGKADLVRRAAEWLAAEGHVDHVIPTLRRLYGLSAIEAVRVVQRARKPPP